MDFKLKKLFSIFFVLTFVFIGLNVTSTSSQAVENCALDGTSIDIDSGTLDSANFKQFGTSSYALDACEHEPDFYKLIGFKIMLCKADPYNENGVAPDFSVCNASLIESSTGAEIVIQPGVETNLLAGAENLIIPVGDYPYAALIASNHIYIKHSESFSRGGSAYTMAGYGTSASGYSTGTSCYTTDRNASAPTSSTYSNATTAASGSNGITTIATTKVTAQSITENVINPKTDDARTLGLACADTIPTTGAARYGYVGEIVDSLNSRVNGTTDCDTQEDGGDASKACNITFGNYENYSSDFEGLDGSAAFNLLKNDETLASNRNEATKIAYIVAFTNPVNISENTTSFKISVSTSSSVSVDSHYSSGEAGGRIQGKKMGANPFSVRFQTKTKRARGAWR